VQQMRVVVCVCLCALSVWYLGHRLDGYSTLAGMKDYCYLAIYV
jgi:hypothetical protein